MLIKGNILDLALEKDYILKDFNNREFPVYYDGKNTHILNYENSFINSSLLNNKCNLRYNFYNEDALEVKNILLKNNIMC